MKLLINGKKYKCNIDGAKYLVNWHPESVPSLGLTSITEYFNEYTDNGSTYNAPTGYSGLRSITLNASPKLRTYSTDSPVGLTYAPNGDELQGFIFDTDLNSVEFISGYLEDDGNNKWVMTYYGNCVSSNLPGECDPSDLIMKFVLQDPYNSSTVTTAYFKCIDIGVDEEVWGFVCFCITDSEGATCHLNPNLGDYGIWYLELTYLDHTGN